LIYFYVGYCILLAIRLPFVNKLELSDEDEVEQRTTISRIMDKTAGNINVKTKISDSEE